MRLAAQAKGGFYPAPLPAVEHALTFLARPKKGKVTICDPCCGEAEALAALGQGLECSPRDIFGVELEPGRARAAKERLPGSHILGPADFTTCDISHETFSFMWVNPPFDDEIGGGNRVEHTFIKKATLFLRTGGVMALVCPENVANNYAVQQHFLTFYDEISITAFPHEHRRFKEVIVFGRKAKEQYHPYGRSWAKECSKFPPIYELPDGHRAMRFTKTELTDDEVLLALDKSPLMKLLEPTDEIPLPRPPLSLGKGHIALLLASGHLDGVVRPPGEMPHVVRGTARKETYLSDVTIEEDKKTGVEKTTETYSQRITLTVRAVDQSGEIKTFTEKNEGEVNADASKTTGKRRGR